MSFDGQAGQAERLGEKAEADFNRDEGDKGDKGKSLILHRHSGCGEAVSWNPAVLVIASRSHAKQSRLLSKAMFFHHGGAEEKEKN